MFNEWDLPKSLKSRFKPEDRPHFDQALRLFKMANPDFTPDEHGINRLCMHLQDMINFLKVHPEKKTDQAFQFSPEGLIRSERARDRLQPEVGRIRRELFGKDTSPFKTVKAASAWLEQEIRADEQRFVEAGAQADRARQLEKEIVTLVRQRNELLPVALSVAPVEKTLDVWRPFKGKKSRGAFYPFRTYPRTRARRLLEEVKGIEAASRFTERMVLYWVLADVTPAAVSISFTITGPTTARAVLTAYKTLPSFGVRQKSLSARSCEIIRFVESRGGPPKERVMEFWRTATKAWNKSHRGEGEGFTSRDGLKKAYERSVVKLPVEKRATFALKKGHDCPKNSTTLETCPR